MQIEDLADLGPTRRSALFEREAGIGDIASDVADIVDAVRERGDQGVRSYTEEFDDLAIGQLEVSADLEAATEDIDPAILDAIRTAAENIRAFHERQRPEDWRFDIGGRTLGQRFRAIERIGAYVPGGTATYPSSALMTVIPAKVAGVAQVAVATPPGDPIDPVTMAALAEAGADEVYRVGGAQAIAALAYGTESIPAVEKIVGPGNRWVAAAKRHVQPDVPIDFVAGPSEILILADASAEPRFVAADLAAQAEHDPRSPCVLVTEDEQVAQETTRELDALLATMDREDIARTALEQPASGIFRARSMSEAIAFAEAFAAEHLSIQAEDDESILERIDSAGSVFLGPYTPVAAGDYASGTNHVLPTNGRARVSGGLSVADFLRSSTVQRLTPGGLEDLAPAIKTLATAEGLDGHARSVSIRTENLE